MSTLKLSMQDKKDLDKFTKFLALKAAQIIVQSRIGEKFNTKCKPNSSGTDWVNISLFYDLLFLFSSLYLNIINECYCFSHDFKCDCLQGFALDN